MQNEKYSSVLTKVDFVRRYKNGEFGNASPTWDTVQEYKDSGYEGLVHIRNRVAGGETWYNVSLAEFDTKWNTAMHGFKPEQLYISAMAPTKLTTFQGEVQQSVEWLDLTFTTVKKPMRDALSERSLSVDGLEAISLLGYYMCPSSYDWLNELLRRYPWHTVEFSCYQIPWGTLPGFNSVFWEVRNY